MALSFVDFGSDHGNGAGRPSLPFELEEIEIFDRTPTQAYVYIRENNEDKRRDEQPSPAKIQKLDIAICDESGRVWARLKGFVSRALDGDLKVVAQSLAAAPANDTTVATYLFVPTS